MSTRRKPGSSRPGLDRHRRRRAVIAPLVERLAALGDGAMRSAAATAARSGLDKARASRALQSLARGGYLERTHDAFDARRTLFRLSTRGRALYRRVSSSARARERALLAGLTAVERRQLDRLLAKLQRAVASAGD